jgi:SAM-dependent methyltransferase
MLTPGLLEYLRSPGGSDVLERARDLRADPFAAEKLRARLGCTPDQAAAAVEQVRLRERARRKFTRADDMWLAPGLLEQASSEEAAAHHAFRLAAFPRVADLCCGLGSDAVAIAARADVAARDRDPLAVALTRANAEVMGAAGRLDARVGDIPDAAPEADAAWIDPGRREGGRRTRLLDGMSPSMSEVLSLAPRYGAIGIKLSPATGDPELDAALGAVPHVRELISVDRECRELIVWTGALAPPGAAHPLRRAVLLPGPHVLEGNPEPFDEMRACGGYLLEPDPAVIRAGLVGNLAALLDAAPIDPRLAYLTTDREVRTPFAAAYRVEPPEPFRLRALAAKLRTLEAGSVVIKTRGAAFEPEELRRRLRSVLKHGRPEREPTVFLTRLGERPVMIVGERFGARDARKHRSEP